MGDFFIPRVKLNKAMILIQFCVNSSIFPLNNQFFAKIKVSENPFIVVTQDPNEVPIEVSQHNALWFT